MTQCRLTLVFSMVYRFSESFLRGWLGGLGGEEPAPAQEVLVRAHLLLEGRAREKLLELREPKLLGDAGVDRLQHGILAELALDMFRPFRRGRDQQGADPR